MAEKPRLICTSGDLVDGGPGVRFSVERDGREVSAFAIRFGGQVYGYINQCGHVPVELDWQPGAFFDDSKLYLICSTHGAIYSPETGQCLAGRCQGRGLIPLPIEERDGVIYF